MDIVKGKIGNALESVAPNHILGVTADIYDEEREQYQSDINEGVGRYVENPEFLRVYTDSDGRFLWGIQRDGNVYFGAGVPQQIKDYVLEKIAEIDFSDIIQEIEQQLDQKVDKVEGKSLIDAGFADGVNIVDNPEYIDVRTDIDGKIIEAIYKNGKKLLPAGLEIKGEIDFNNATTEAIDNPEFLRVYLDADNHVLFGIRRDGTCVFKDENNGISESIIRLIEEVAATKVDKEEGKSLIDAEVAESFSTADYPEFLKAVTDSEGKVLAGIKKDGKVWLNDLEVDGKDFYIVTESPEWLKVVIDSEGKVIAGIRKDGSTYIAKLDAGDTIAAILAEFEERIAEIEDDIDAKMALFDAVFSEFTDPEGRIQITTDADNRILSYRDKEGVLHENNLAIENKLELSDEAMTDFQQSLKAAGFHPGGGGDFSDAITEKGKKPVYIPMPRLARVNIIWDGDLTALSKADRGGIQKVNYDVKVPVEFFDGQGVYFKKYALMSAQGNSSMDFIKKNISLKFFDTEDVEGKKKKWGKGDTFGTVFGDWVMQKTYHLKAFYTDFIRGSSEVAYQLADEVYKTRGIYADRPWKKALINFNKITSQTPAGLSKDGSKDMNLQIDNGARCMPDGFPVIVYQNGEFYGIFIWMLKKDADNFNMDTSEVKHIHIDGDLYASNLWGGTINWTSFEVRNPEDLVCMDGSDYDGDHPAELIDSTSEHYDSTDENHVRSAQVKQYIINLSNRVGEINTLNATDSAADKELFDTYFDADSLIDYQLINMACGDNDGFGKNWQWTTWDGVKWYVNQYDKDMAFGNYWTGMFTTSPKNGWLFNDTNLPSGLAIRYYTPEHKARWQELVNVGIFNAEHIKSMITSWISRIGKDNFAQEWKKWSESPCNRGSKIDFEYWMFTGTATASTPSTGTIWDENTAYNVGDTVWFKAFDGNWHLQFEAVKAGSNHPCLSGSYSGYPKSMGYRDSAWRFYKYIEETISNQNSFINSL